MSTEESLPVVPPEFILSFLGVHQQDLPYYGKNKDPESVEAAGVPLRLTKQQEDASQLLFSLTGVSSQISSGITATKNGRNSATAVDFRKEEASLEFYKEVGGGVSGDSDACTQQNNVKGSPRKVLPCIEKGLDTCDLGFWTCMVSPDRNPEHEEEEDNSDADSEGQAQTVEKTALQEKALTEDCTEEDERSKKREYWGRVKETLGFVQMRMQILQELSSGSGAKGESPLTIGANKDNQGTNASIMNGVSMNVKQARKLAGLVHMEEQAFHLQDLQQWLHKVGKGLEEDAINAQPKSILQNKLECLQRLNIAKELQEPTPTHASSELLQQVEHNLRDRLANLYQGKNFILRNQASAKLESEAINAKMTKDGTLERLQKIESAYEMLGSTIMDSLRQVEKMEEEFHVLQSELEAKGCPLLTIRQIKKIKKSRHKGTKKSTHSESDGGSSQSEVSSAANSNRVASAKSEKESSAENDGGGDINGNNDAKDTTKDMKSDTKDTNNRAKNGKKDMMKVTSDLSETAGSDKASMNGKKKEKKKKSLAQKAKKQGENKINTIQEEKNAENSAPHAATTLTLHQVNEIAQSVSPPTVTEVPHLQIMTVKDMSANGNILSENRETLLSNSGGNEEHPPMRKSTSSAEKRNTQDVSFSIKDRGNIKPQNSETIQTAAKFKRQYRRSCFDGFIEEAVQTDDVAILSLEDGCDNAFSKHYEQMDGKAIVENMKKLQKQLQFWRAKNWAEKHTENRQLQAPVYSSVSQFTKLHTSPDMGLVLYYNPQTGLRTMKNVSDLDSNTQQAIFSLTGETKHSVNNA